jgi:transposase
MEEIRAEVKPLLSNQSWEVFTADETRLEKQSEIRRAWLKKGGRTVVETERSKEHQNYLGFLNQKNGECDVYEIDRGNTEETIMVLRKLLKKYPDKKICIVWNNARWHRSKGLRGLLGKGNEFENIHLIWLPPYSPEHNPIEHVWGWAKDKTANRSSVLMSKLKEEFLNSINSRNFDYKL